jgi:2-C-methyl-D-erythritol 4-phosphate cytidylyltransferase
MRCGAVIPAAGQARRFGDVDKTLKPLAGSPTLEWAIRALVNSEKVTQIVIVVSDANHFPVLDLIARIRPSIAVATVRGGERRMDSVQAGVRSLENDCELVLIHDAARPLITPELIRIAVEEGRKHGAVIPATPVTDTIKRVDGSSVLHTVDRSELVAVQTPQVFRRDWLLDAYQSCGSREEATDEAAILEAAGYPVRIFPGDPANIKVTTATDAVLAEALLREREDR